MSEEQAPDFGTHGRHGRDGEDGEGGFTSFVGPNSCGMDRMECPFQMSRPDFGWVNVSVSIKEFSDFPL